MEGVTDLHVSSSCSCPGSLDVLHWLQEASDLLLLVPVLLLPHLQPHLESLRLCACMHTMHTERPGSSLCFVGSCSVRMQDTPGLTERCTLMQKLVVMVHLATE